MNDDQLINQTADFVKAKFEGEGSGHDWWHMYRVWQLSKTIAADEKAADMLVVELAALLHDIADWKFHDGDLEAGPKAARDWLESQNADEATIVAVETIIRKVSFKGAGESTPMSSPEGRIVQDADRLDALGAIGIARTFAYGGSKGRPLYDPGVKPESHADFAAYSSSAGPTINHFYEKLLLLKARMNTDTGKRLAEQRHRYLENFLDEFYAEWDGER